MLNADRVAITELSGLSQWIVSELRDELRDQGHNLTGRLSNSVAADATEDADGWDIDFSHEKYGVYLDFGVRPDRIPYSPGSGARYSKYIQALKDWVLARGIKTNDRAALRVAFAIARVQKREGMPTRGSFRFSSNGRRKGWVQYPASSKENDIQQALYDFYENFIDASIDDEMTELANRYKNTMTWSL